MRTLSATLHQREQLTAWEERKNWILFQPPFSLTYSCFIGTKSKTPLTRFTRRESFCTPKNPRLHVSGSMTSVTTVCCGKAQPQPKAQGPSPTYLQRPCKENPSTRPPSDSAVKLLRQLPLPILPHLRAHRKAQSSYSAASLQRWVSSRGNKHQKCKEVHKKGGKVKLNNILPNATPYSRIPTPPSSVAEVGHSFTLRGNIYSQPGVQAKHKESDVLAPHLTRQTLPNPGAGSKLHMHLQTHIY